MAGDKKISQLTEVYDLLDTDLVTIVRGGVNYKLTGANLKANSLPYKSYSALLTQTTFSTTSGLLVIGTQYVIETLQAGDDFTNVGYVSDGVVFTATGTTPTVWTNSTEVIEYIGSNPVATVQSYSTLTGIIWTRVSGATYYGTKAGAFPVDKTIYLISPTGSSLFINRIDDDTIIIQTSVDGDLDNTTVEIRVSN